MLFLLCSKNRRNFKADVGLPAITSLNAVQPVRQHEAGDGTKYLAAGISDFVGAPPL
jgi:hypothetical protein